MSIRSHLSPDGDTLNIYVGERFDFSVHQAFRAAYDQPNLPRLRIRVNLRDTRYMDSSALGMLLVLRERAGGERADITLSGVTPGIFQVLSISRLELLFKIE